MRSFLFFIHSKPLLSMVFLLFWSFNASAKPLVIQTDNGSITLAEPAKKIVVLEFSLLDDLLQLGVKPIGIASSRSDEGTNPPFLLPQIKDITNVGTRQQPNLEKIMSLHPDLIVADKTMQVSIYPLLKQIAPTLMLNGLGGDTNTQINNLRLLAEVTNTQSKVAKLAEQMRAQYAAAKKLGMVYPARVIIGYASNAGEFQALTANALTSIMLKDFGHSNLMTMSRKEQSTPIPMETILVQDPDSIIVLLTDGDLRPYQSMIRHPLWKELRAVKTKHIYFADRDVWAKNHGVLATEMMLKQARDTGFLMNKPNSTL